MSGFKIRSGSAVVASTDCIKNDTYVPQAHNQLNWFKSHITNSRLSRVFIGWRSLITQRKESPFVHFFNYITSFIPVYSRKIFQHSLVYCWLQNGKKIIVEYGAYNENYDNSPYNTQIYYWNERKYGLRIYEDPNSIFFRDTDWIELQFNDHGNNFNEIIDRLNIFNDYSKEYYDLIILNCQRFCQNLISLINGKRFQGKDFRGNHTLSFALIPAYIAQVLEDNEKDDSNFIGYIPIIGDQIDKIRCDSKILFNYLKK